MELLEGPARGSTLRLKPANITVLPLRDSGRPAREVKQVVHFDPTPADAKTLKQASHSNSNLRSAMKSDDQKVAQYAFVPASHWPEWECLENDRRGWTCEVLDRRTVRGEEQMNVTL